MPTPFPGMDPYLERSALWRQVHTGLIVDIQRFLAPRLRPRYHVAIEQYNYLALLPLDDRMVGIPDVLVVAPPGTVAPAPAALAAMAAPATTRPFTGQLPMPEEIKQRYLEIRDVATREVITVIEILSLTNKKSPDGREQYKKKRLKVLSSQTNLVEIDLLRDGEPLPMYVPETADYRIVVSRSPQRPTADFYLFGLRQPVPSVPIPLRPEEEEPILPLNDLLHAIYDQGAYDLVIDYQQPPVPPLAQEDAAWVRSLLRAVLGHAQDRAVSRRAQD